eukprot:2095921-Pyramimonas_sp.AAC.1
MLLAAMPLYLLNPSIGVHVSCRVGMLKVHAPHILSGIHGVNACRTIHGKIEQRAGPVWTLFECYSRLQESPLKAGKDEEKQEGMTHQVMTKQQLFEMVRTKAFRTVNNTTRYIKLTSAAHGTRRTSRALPFLMLTFNVHEPYPLSKS